MLRLARQTGAQFRHLCLVWNHGFNVDDQINELAHGLEHSKVKFLWVLRDADKSDVFEGEVRRAELPEGLEERVAAWPMHSDQPMNTAPVTDILKISIVVRDWKQRSELVKASTIENALKRLMASPEGDEIRKTVEELGGTVRLAAQPGGASRLEMDSFIAHYHQIGINVEEFYPEKIFKSKTLRTLD